MPPVFAGLQLLNEELFDSLADARRKLALALRLQQRPSALVAGKPNTGTSAPGVPARWKRHARRACAVGAALNIKPVDSRYDRGTSGGPVSTYRFGGDWRHYIEIDSVFAADPEREYPRFVDGERGSQAPIATPSRTRGNGPAPSHSCKATGRRPSSACRTW